MKKTLCVGFLLAVFLLTLSGCDKSRENSLKGKKQRKNLLPPKLRNIPAIPPPGRLPVKSKVGRIGAELRKTV